MLRGGFLAHIFLILGLSLFFTSTLSAQDFYRLDLGKGEKISGWSGKGDINDSKFLSHFAVTEVNETMVVEDVGTRTAVVGDTETPVRLLRWYEYIKKDGKHFRRETDQYYLFTQSDFDKAVADKKFVLATADDKSGILKIQKNESRLDTILDTSGNPKICVPKSKLESDIASITTKAAEQAPIAANIDRTPATASPRKTANPSVSNSRNSVAEPTPLPGEDFIRPEGPISSQSELNSRLQLKQRRIQYYNSLIDHYRSYQLSPKLLESIRARKELPEVEQRPLRLEAIRRLLKTADQDPFFAGKRGAQRLNDLVGSLQTITMEFLSEKHATPFNLEASLLSILNRANAENDFAPVYCNISLHYCANLDTNIRNGWTTGFDSSDNLSQTPMGAALAATIVRTPAEVGAKLSVRATLLKRLIHKQNSNLSDEQLIQKVKNISDSGIVEVFANFLSNANDRRAYIENPNDPDLREKVNEALWEEIAAPRKLKASSEDIVWAYQYSAWDFRNPQLSYILSLSHSEAAQLRPLETASINRSLDHLAARDSGLVRYDGASRAEREGLLAATHYMSPVGMSSKEEFERRKSEWDGDMYEIRYPTVVRDDLNSDGRPRTSLNEPALQSKVNKNLIVVYRKRTASERKSGKRAD